MIQGKTISSWIILFLFIYSGYALIQSNSELNEFVMNLELDYQESILDERNKVTEQELFEYNQLLIDFVVKLGVFLVLFMLFIQRFGNLRLWERLTRQGRNEKGT